jgi:hypothetical protein
MRVKTDIGALVSGGVIALVLTLVATGDGSPSKGAPAAPVASGAVITPLPSSDEAPTFQKNTSSAWDNAQDGTVGPARKPPPPRQAAPRPIPHNEIRLDAYVLQGLRGGLVYILLFVGLHLGLRRGGLAQRWSYAGAGALAALVAVSLATPGSAWGGMIARGNLSFFLGVIGVAGAIMGFIYHWRAGLEAGADDPQRLQEAVGAQRGEAETVTADEVLIDTGEEEYFSGPLQVRTSLPIAFIAALLSAGAFALVRALLSGFAEFSSLLPEHRGAPMLDLVSQSLAGQLLDMALLAVMAPVPFAFVVLIGHMIARAWGKSSYQAYMLIGATAPVLLGLLAGVVGVFIGLQALVPLAIAMAVYRNMAGLEPKPVKEDIILNDRRNLVGEQHARRQFGRLIKG